MNFTGLRFILLYGVVDFSEGSPAHQFLMGLPDEIVAVFKHSKQKMYL